MRRLFGGRGKSPKVLILGLDCASPELVFDTFKDHLPHLQRLMNHGSWGVLRSSIPCITVPAWASMTSSRDAGVLGIYGFRNRASWDYDALTTATSNSVCMPRLWDVLGTAGKQSLIVNVPLTTPVKPIHGTMVGDFLTSDTSSAFAYPAIVRNEVLQRAPDYRFDVGDFRTSDKATLLQRLYDFTDTQYRVFDHLLTSRSWDLAMHVNMGIDRVHHGFWRYHDATHRLHEPSAYQHAIRDYYAFVDGWIGRLLERVDDQTHVMVVSDHGVKRMDGAIALNEWLRLNGWLVLKQPLGEGITRFDTALVDWSKTRAWSTGGYYGRVFLNVQGREPHGVIVSEALEATVAELSALLAAIPDEQGRRLPTRVMRPSEVYQQVNGFAPDLIVYFGDLHWRTVGGLGYGTHFTLENDTGPDDANHAEEGMFIHVDPRRAGQGEQAARQLMDIAPMVLKALGVAIPTEMQGCE